MIYLDYAATTPVDKQVADKMYEVLRKDYGNPSSKHFYGQKAKDLIEESRYNVANLIGALPDEIYFTGSATEANNMVVKALNDDDTLCTSEVEHKAILEPAKRINHIKCKVLNDCVLDFDELEYIFKNNPVNLCSIMHVNNETGIINDVEKICDLCQEYGIIYHTDATQSVGKLEFDVKDLGIDLLSLSAHKFYGPKGVGALYISNDLDKDQWKGLIEGGSQEKGIRSGTQNVPSIVGLGEAAKISKNRIREDFQNAEKLEEILLDELSYLDNVKLNGCLENKCPWINNFTFENCWSGDVLRGVEDEICLSKSTACAINDDPSHVLKAMGLSDEDCKCSLRVSFGRYSTPEEVRLAALKIKNAVNKIAK